MVKSFGILFVGVSLFLNPLLAQDLDQPTACEYLYFANEAWCRKDWPKVDQSLHAIQNSYPEFEGRWQAAYLEAKCYLESDRPEKAKQAYSNLVKELKALPKKPTVKAICQQELEKASCKAMQLIYSYEDILFRSYFDLAGISMDSKNYRQCLKEVEDAEKVRANKSWCNIELEAHQRKVEVYYTMAYSGLKDTAKVGEFLVKKEKFWANNQHGNYADETLLALNLLFGKEAVKAEFEKGLQLIFQKEQKLGEGEKKYSYSDHFMPFFNWEIRILDKDTKDPKKWARKSPIGQALLGAID